MKVDSVDLTDRGKCKFCDKDADVLLGGWWNQTAMSRKETWSWNVARFCFDHAKNCISKDISTVLSDMELIF